MRLVRFSAGKDSQWLQCYEQTRQGTKCSSEGEESHAEQEANGLEESEAAMTDEGEKEKQEQQAGERERAQETNLLQERGKNTMQHTCRFASGAHTA